MAAVRCISTSIALCHNVATYAGLFVLWLQITTMLAVTNLPPTLFDHTPPGVFDGQGSGHDFYGVRFTCFLFSYLGGQIFWCDMASLMRLYVQTAWNPPSGYVSGMDGDRAGQLFTLFFIFVPCSNSNCVTISATYVASTSATSFMWLSLAEAT